MADLSTKYMGLDLKNPIIIGSSQLTSKTENIKKLAEAEPEELYLNRCLRNKLKWKSMQNA